MLNTVVFRLSNHFRIGLVKSESTLTVISLLTFPLDKRDDK